LSDEEWEEEDDQKEQEQKEDSDSEDGNEDLEGDYPEDEDIEDTTLSVQDPEVPDFDTDGFGVEATVTDDGEDGTNALTIYDESRIKHRCFNDEQPVITERLPIFNCIGSISLDNLSLRGRVEASGLDDISRTFAEEVDSGNT
jgi:hypothetical protein